MTIFHDDFIVLSNLVLSIDSYNLLKMSVSKGRLVKMYMEKERSKFLRYVQPIYKSIIHVPLYKD